MFKLFLGWRTRRIELFEGMMLFIDGEGFKVVYIELVFFEPSTLCHKQETAQPGDGRRRSHPGHPAEGREMPCDGKEARPGIIPPNTWGQAN